MTRIKRGYAVKGSQKWLQEAVNSCPEVLNCALQVSMNLPESDHIEWISPLKCEDYAEYRDQLFLEKLGIELPIRSLKSFWPRGGPVWDGLAKTESGEVILVDTKAHVAEMMTTPSRAMRQPADLINTSLEEVRAFLSTKVTSDWSTSFYQYQNRLAHLYLLREVNKIQAWLLCVYFVNAPDVKRSASIADWKKAIRIMHSRLGILHHKLLPYVIYIYLDANDICSRINPLGQSCKKKTMLAGSL